MHLRAKIIFIPFLLSATVGWAQEGTLSSSKPQTMPTVDNAPVTCKEAKEVIDEVQAAMENAALMKAAPASRLAVSEKAVTRAQVLDDLARLEQEFRPVYVLKPRTQYCDPAVVKFAEPERKKAIRLIKLGFLEPVAPLVVGPDDKLTVGQFSEALAFFVERWADMTHIPTTKWSPDLQHRAPMRTPRAGRGGPVPLSASPRRA